MFTIKYIDKKEKSSHLPVDDASWFSVNWDFEYSHVVRVVNEGRIGISYGSK